MRRSFDLVDSKIAEADFFLSRIPDCGPEFFAVRCYVSAFVSSARSVTFALQSCLKDVEGFDSWYASRQEELRRDSLAQFFNEFRRVNQHIGDNPVTSASLMRDRCRYYFNPTREVQSVPEVDVETACRTHLTTVLSIVYDCYTDFGPHIDPKQHYTAEHFASIGKTIEDADEELFGSRDWTKVPGYSEAYRWQALRDSMPGCQINHIFQTYLGKTTPEPARLPEFPLPDGPGWHRTKKYGRVYIPDRLRGNTDPDKHLERLVESLRMPRSLG